MKITDGMAEMEVGALSERAPRCPGEQPSDEYECGEKLMSTRINRGHSHGSRSITHAAKFRTGQPALLSRGAAPDGADDGGGAGDARNGRGGQRLS